MFGVRRWRIAGRSPVERTSTGSPSIRPIDVVRFTYRRICSVAETRPSSGKSPDQEAVSRGTEASGACSVLGVTVARSLCCARGAPCSQQRQRRPTQRRAGNSNHVSNVPQGGNARRSVPSRNRDCFDWIGQCAGSRGAPGYGAVTTHAAGVRRRDATATCTRTSRAPVLTGVPTFGHVAEADVTYNINRTRCGPTACRSRAPTSSTRADQISERHGHLRPHRLRSTSTSVDVSDPKTAVVTYKARPYAGWQQLFGGGYGILPSHLLKGKDRDAVDEGRLRRGRAARGSPSGTRATRRHAHAEPEVYGHQAAPRQGRVQVLRPTPRPEFQAFKSGQVDAIYPQPQLDVVDADQGRAARTRTRRSHDRHRHGRSAVDQQRASRRSTRRRSARRSATRSTATRS